MCFLIPEWHGTSHKTVFKRPSADAAARFLGFVFEIFWTFVGLFLGPGEGPGPPKMGPGTPGIDPKSIFFKYFQNVL